MSWEFFFAAETADRAAATLLHSLWQAALLAVVAAVLCRLLRLAVTAQYLVYATALALCAAALPLTYWMIEVDGRPVVAAATKATTGESRQRATGVSPAVVAPLAGRTTTVRQPLRPHSQPAASGSTERTPSLAATWQRAIPWLLVCYAVGVIGMLVRLALGVIGAERLRRAALPITDGHVMRSLTAARRRWPLHIAPAVARSEQVVVPALVGLLKPTILLPASAAAGLTPQELELVLAHELAHVVRRDLWVTLFQRIVETVLFFNPAIWYLSRRTSTLREFCADEAACRERATRVATVRVDYASALLRMAELARPSLSVKPELLALAAAGRSPSEFRRRIARLLGEPVREPLQASRSGLALVALATVALAVGVAWAEPGEQPAEDAEPTANESAPIAASTPSTHAVVHGKNDATVAEIKNKAEQDRLINETPINSVADAIKVLTEGPDVDPTKVWVRAIKYLVDHKEEAFPAVVAALDAEERDHPISKLAFTLRAMGDQRAVPALIRALPKTLLPSRSDYGLLLDGGGSDHDELLRFMAENDQSDGNDGEGFDYCRAFREVAVSLEKLTDQNFGEMELNWVHRAESPTQLAQQQEQFHRVARRWAEWWETNRQTQTDDDKFAKVNLTPLASASSRVFSRELPTERGVFLEETNSEWIVQSAHDSKKRCFVDLDTMREGGWPESLPPIEEIGADAPEVLAWARAEGFDLMGVTHTPPGKKTPLYCLKPLEMSTWKIKPRELRDIKEPAAGLRTYPLSRPVDLMAPRPVIKPPFDHEVDGDSFLYVTREGTAGVIRMTAQVPENNAEVGRAYSQDDEFMPTGFYPGAKVTFAVLRKSEEAVEEKAPSEEETTPGAPAPAPAPTPASNKPESSRSEAKPEDRGGATLKATIKSVQGKPLENVYLTLWREAPSEQAAASSKAAKSADLGFYRNVIWDDAATKIRWERNRSAHPNDGRHGRGEMNFHFDKLPAGKYRLTAVSYDSKAATPDPTPFAVSDVITLDDEGEKQVELTTLSGDVQLQLRVVDAETRQPVSGVAIRLRGATDMPIVHGHGSGNFFEWTDEAGGVRYGTLPAGSYSIEVLGKYAAVNNFVEYPALADRVEVAVLGDHTVEIALPPRRLDEEEIERRFPFSAFGVVTDDQGKPMQGVEVRAATGIGTLMGGGRVKTDSEGRYRLYFGAGMHMEASDWAPMSVGVQAAQFYATIDGWEMPEDRTEYNLLMSDRPREALATDREDSIEAWGVKDLDRVVYPNQPREINFRMKTKGRPDTESTDAPSEKETLPGAPAPAPAPAPSSNTPEGPGSEAKPEDDSSAIQKLKVIVVDEAGQPIEGALVRQNHVYLPLGAPDDGKHLQIKNENYRTDAAGEATVIWEGKSVDLRIWASHPDRVPLHAMWASAFQADGDKIPAEFRFELQPGTTIGGVVRDETGKPIAGAKVVIVNHAAFTPAGSATQTGNRPVAVPWLAEEDSAIVTDAEGRWKATNIPSDEELNRPQYVTKGAYTQDGKAIPLPQDGKGLRIAPKFLGPPLRLQITHDQFAPYNGRRDWTRQGAPSLSELREGAGIVVLSKKNDENVATD